MTVNVNSSRRDARQDVEHPSGYKRSVLRFRGSPQTWGLESIGVEIVRYSAPLISDVQLLTMENYFAAEVTTTAFAASWTRARASARRRVLMIFPRSGVLNVESGPSNTLKIQDRVWLVLPGSTPVLMSSDNHFEGIFFAFDAREVLPSLAASIRPGKRELGSPILDMMRPMLESFVRYPRVDDVLTIHNMRSLLRSMARSLVLELLETGNHVSRDLAGEIRAIVRLRHQDPALTPHSIALGLSISRRTADRVMSDSGDVSLAQLIRSERAHTAKTLLQTQRQLSIEEVWVTSGFPSKETMRRALRDIFNRSPREIRTAPRVKR
ncbi:helix-turn-helix domain-containing protein [Pseudoclavibacter sp. Z016]|uniref:AraC family transcriptional regulator n=1 Tax=Pseudoclavibacter sp. Z016 TaxID=2080581 RepID=UPI0011B0B2FF|nr:helix-turn-helix domain-containing protein [Pseudoclavibacter sp. Z016]